MVPLAVLGPAHRYLLLPMTYKPTNTTRINAQGVGLLPELWAEIGRPPAVTLVVHAWDLLIIPGSHRKIIWKNLRPTVQVWAAALYRHLLKGGFDASIELGHGRYIYRVRACALKHHNEYLRI